VKPWNWITAILPLKVERENKIADGKEKGKENKKYRKRKSKS
jgi:hypothetical protein